MCWREEQRTRGTKNIYIALFSYLIRVDNSKRAKSDELWQHVKLCQKVTRKLLKKLVEASSCHTVLQARAPALRGCPIRALDMTSATWDVSSSSFLSAIISTMPKLQELHAHGPHCDVMDIANLGSATVGGNTLCRTHTSVPPFPTVPSRCSQEQG